MVAQSQRGHLDVRFDIKIPVHLIFQVRFGYHTPSALHSPANGTNDGSKQLIGPDLGTHGSGDFIGQIETICPLIDLFVKARVLDCRPKVARDGGE